MSKSKVEIFEQTEIDSMSRSEVKISEETEIDSMSKPGVNTLRLDVDAVRINARHQVLISKDYEPAGMNSKER